MDKKEFTKNNMQSLKDICKLYECDVELIQPYHARIYYYDKPIFDFFPKSKRLFNINEKNFKKAWHTLNDNWKKQIHSILKIFVITEELIIK